MQRRFLHNSEIDIAETARLSLVAQPLSALAHRP